MVDTSGTFKPDVEEFDPTSTFDAVLINLFRTIEAPETAVGRILRLILQKLWCSNKFAHPKNDITARLAALDLAAGGIQFGTDTTKYDFSEYMKIWEYRTKDCAMRIEQISFENPKVLSHVCRYLKERIEISQPSFSVQPKKSLAELVIYLYSVEADKVAGENNVARLAYDPEEEFQIEVVTFLKFCGGEPSKIRTCNIPNTLDWDEFQQYLATTTSNWQSAMLGYPDGYKLAKGVWHYQIIKNGALQPVYYQLTGEDQFHKLANDMLFDPERKDEVPRFIHAKQYMVSKTLRDKQRRLREDPDFGFGGVYDLNDESGYSYLPLPPGFIPTLQSNPDNAFKTANKIEKIKAATAKREAEAAAKKIDKRLEKKMQRRKEKRRNRKDKIIQSKYGGQSRDGKRVTDNGEESEEDDESDDDLFVAPAPTSATKPASAPSRQPALRLFPRPRPRRSLTWRPTTSISSQSLAALESASKPNFSYDKYRSVEDEVADEEESEEE